MKANRMKSYLINTLLTIALCAAYGLTSGILGTAIGLLISALLGALYYREHFALGIANSLVALIIFTLFFGPVQALIAGVPMLLLALALALGTRFKLSIYKLLFLCSVLFLLELLFNLGLVGQLSGGEVTLSSMMLEMGRQTRELMLQQYSNPEMAGVIEQAIFSAIDMSIMLAPTIFTVISIVLAFTLISIYKKMMLKHEDMSFLLPFNALQGDKPFSVFYLALVFLFLAAPEGLFFDAAANVVLILGFLFVMLGLAVFNCKLKQNGTKRTARRVLTAALICFSTVFFMLPLFALLICGLADSFFDYRHLRPTEPKKTERQ